VRRTRFPTYPLELRSQRLADGGQPLAGCGGNALFLARDSEEGVAGPDLAADDRCISLWLINRSQVDAGDVNAPTRSR
jgi:hypothetical protein